MGRNRRKKVPWLVLLLGVFVIVAIGVALKDSALRCYHLHVLASGTTPAPELTQQEAEWRRILSTEAQLGFPAGISLSEVVHSLGQLTPLEFAVTNDEKGLKVSPGRQETVTIEAFLQHLLNLASTRTGIEFVCMAFRPSFVIN